MLAGGASSSAASADGVTLLLNLNSDGKVSSESVVDAVLRQASAKAVT